MPAAGPRCPSADRWLRTASPAGTWRWRSSSAAERHGDIPVGVRATDERGNYDGALVLPSTLPLGDYEAHARTLGDARCGRGQSE